MEESGPSLFALGLAARYRHPPQAGQAASHRIQENIDLFDFALSNDEIEQDSKLDKYRSFKTNPNPLGLFLGGPFAWKELISFTSRLNGRLRKKARGLYSEALAS